MTDSPRARLEPLYEAYGRQELTNAVLSTGAPFRGSLPGLLTFRTIAQPQYDPHTYAMQSTKDGPPSSILEQG